MLKGYFLVSKEDFNICFFFRRKVIKVVIDFGVGVGNWDWNLIIY